MCARCRPNPVASVRYVCWHPFSESVASHKSLTSPTGPITTTQVARPCALPRGIFWCAHHPSWGQISCLDRSAKGMSRACRRRRRVDHTNHDGLWPIACLPIMVARTGTQRINLECALITNSEATPVSDPGQRTESIVYNSVAPVASPSLGPSAK